MHSCARFSSAAASLRFGRESAVPNYARIAAGAARQIERAGAPAVLTRAVTGDYDPTIAEPDDGGTQVYNTFAVRAEYKNSEIDGTRIVAGDVRLYVSPALATEPAPGDVITFDGVDWLVVSSRPIKPATIVACHDVQVRNA